MVHSRRGRLDHFGSYRGCVKARAAASILLIALGGLTAWAVLPGWLGSSPILSAALTVWSGGLSWCAARWC